MNEKAKAQKIARFLADEAMNQAVREVMLATFLEPSKQTDVAYLAARMIAIELMQTAFKKMETYRLQQEQDPGLRTQPGM